MKEVLCVVLGGGRGSRLFPLTKERCKPAAPLFGKYRLIDIPVSNCLNSGFNRIYILTQFLSESLNKHINRTYKLDPFTKGFIEIMAAEQSMEDTDWFQGTADAVRRCLKHFNNPMIKYIFVLSGDQLYKMDMGEMYRYHRQQNAELTIACNHVAEENTRTLGIIGTDKNNRINHFIEKPSDLSQIKKLAVEYKGKKSFLGSMGMYLFNKSTLVDILARDKRTDFGKEIIPDAIHKNVTYAFPFDGYWRDIGTIKAFYEENLFLTESMPPLDVFDERWQFFTRTRYLSPAKFENCQIERTIVAEGAIVMSSKIDHSIIGLRFRVGTGTKIKDTIAMGCDYYETVEEIKNNWKKDIPPLGVGENCDIRKAILDKNVRIGNNVSIINEQNLEHFEGPNYFIREGIVIVTKNSVIPSGTVI
ncbi:MAG: glucose-1-phosphate adenylyltransferase [Candidatus Omnitrophica bacterium]|nr:glucose-1-phosphate adenylyltransferase [Candidatus Omnitrophota bacterium]